ncbi:MAG TPA: MerR family transcriptional regulator [Amycolatopsis sp.]|uniref:MerR family transcriptional regulator n=1 Tax=Amycolatopsis sp. TaxID=37632 RepID=UPI002B48C8E5|nr:MerR family transcriptional regulator [Amycolatopsis sp.]HKS47948.1 MerR family transcriptional regulator [Amycolatopsis sp.]
MAELSSASGVPVATIKYYLREGLLPPGERTSPNQARYGEEHVRRLKMVRALLDVGGLSIAGVREVLAAIDDRTSTHSVLGIAQHGLPAPKPRVDDESRAWAMSLIEKIGEERGWDVKSDDVVVESLVGTLCVYAELNRTDLLARISDYAELAEGLAEVDLGMLSALPTTESIVEGAVIGTVLGDALFTALRRLGHQNASARRFRR